MKLDDAKTLANLLIEKHLDTTWKFRFNNRKMSFGVCKHNKHIIELSGVLTPIETEYATEQTILHEIAHAKTPGSGHNRLWKVVAMAIGVKNPTATRAHTSNEDDRPSPTWVLVYMGKVLREYYRKPSHKMFASLSNKYILGRYTETYGKLEYLPYADYLKINS